MSLTPTATTAQPFFTTDIAHRPRARTRHRPAPRVGPTHERFSPRCLWSASCLAPLS